MAALRRVGELLFLRIHPAASFCSLLRVRLCLCLALPAFASGLCATWSRTLAVGLAAMVLGGFAYGWWYYFPRYVASCAVERRRDGFAVLRGVWWRRTFFLPDARTLFAERLQTPLGRVFGVEAVRFHLVGRTLTVAGLLPGDAVALTAVRNE